MRHGSTGWVALATALLVTLLGACAHAGEGTPSQPSTLMILPFAPINPADPDAWLGKSIQQSLVSELTVNAPRRVIASETPAVDDAAAIEAAKKAGATYVIRGQFVTSGGDLRITGQALDAQTGRPISAIKATGPTSSLFALEDELTAQVRRRLALNPPAPSTNSAPSEGSASAELQVPPMEAMHMPSSAQAPDAFVQAYVAPLNPLASSDRQHLDNDYYFGQPAPILGCGAYGCGIGGGYYGGGCGFGSSGFHGGGFGGGALSGGWNNPFGTAAVHTGNLAPFHSATLHGLPSAPAAGAARKSR